MKRRPKALEERRRLLSRCSLTVVFLTASAIVSLLSANPVMHASYDADHEVLPAPAVELSGAVLPAVSSTAAEIVQLLNSHPVAALLMEVNGGGENLLSPASADFSGGEDGQLTSTASQVAEFLAASPETSALFTVTGGGGHVLNPAGPLALAGGSSSVERDSTSYAWDAQGRLAAVTMKDGLKYGYRYDYRTRRVGIERAAHGDAPARHTAVAFSGGLSLVEHESEARPASLQGLAGTVRYVRGPDMGGGVGGLLYSRRGETLKYNLSNGRGDIVAQSDAAGALTWTASYEAYGKRTKETGENADKQRANTKDEDPTGLLNEGFRYRDLETGVWLSRDPAGFVDGPNLYAYVKQNPWTSWDPDGLKSKSDYRRDMARATERRSADLKRLPSNASDRARFGIENRYQKAMRKAQQGIDGITATARSMEAVTRSQTGSINDEFLDDEDNTYTSFNRISMLGAVLPMKFGEHVHCGEKGEAAKELAKFAAINLALYGAGKGLQVLGKAGVPSANSGVQVASGMGGEVLPMQVIRTLPPGTAGGVINEAKALTFATGNEHAVVRLATGERALASGGPGGINMGDQVTRIIGHTHPYGTMSAGASAADRAALQTLGQTHSYILEGGQTLRFGPTP